MTSHYMSAGPHPAGGILSPKFDQLGTRIETRAGPHPAGGILSRRPPPAPAVADGVRGAAGRPAAYRVLCVDDNRDAAETLAVVLGLCGFDARACADGPAALREFGRFGPHACVLDLRMPGMDGFELARRLRVESRGRPLVLLTASGLAGPDVADRAAAAGFDAVYAKPLDPQAFADLLDVLLAQTFEAVGPDARTAPGEAVA